MIIKHLSEHKIFWLLSAVGWTILIAFLCLIDNSDLPSMNLKISGIDKLVHFLFHFIFTLFWSIYYFSKQKSLSSKVVTAIIFTSLLFGILIEWLQDSFTLTRQADIFDVIFNFSGAVTAGLLVYHYLKKNLNTNT
jgi:VanZ family protein